jgi:hypothetical protein
VRQFTFFLLLFLGFVICFLGPYGYLPMQNVITKVFLFELAQVVDYVRCASQSYMLQLSVVLENLYPYSLY